MVHTITDDFEAETLISSPPGAFELAPQSGALIGRYVVLNKLGAGAMGVVLAAYDPELDRKVALKLIKPQGDGSFAGRTRLQREAQALAKLDHPNVVSVHDVGVHDGQLYITMEFVEGETLREWMASEHEPRPWRRVLEVFAAAGRGLAAAHDAGMVHRDFKPDNVMIGVDGRVRVMDFGLARTDTLEESSGSVVAVSDITPALFDHLTQTGSLMGTPAYMSPEQIKGEPADARSDQFGYCIALYEALYDARPFVARNMGELYKAISTSAIRPEPRGTSVPSWVRKIVLRGLAVEPPERYASMLELLGALAQDPAQGRRRRLVGALAGVALAAMGFGGSQALDREAELCAPRASDLAGVWGRGRRAQVRAALKASAPKEATIDLRTWARVEAELDDYMQRWSSAWTEVCEATQHGAQSGELLDLRMACLDDRLVEVGALVGVLAEADESIYGEAVNAVLNLPTLDRCADVDALRAEIPPPEDPQIAAQVTALERQLAEAKALAAAAKRDRASELVETVLAESERIDHPPLRARALLMRGNLQDDGGDYVAAEATLVEAYSRTLSLGMYEDAALAAAKLGYLTGGILARYDDGERWLLDAEGLATASGSDVVLASVSTARGVMAGNRGQYARSREYLERSLALRSSMYGEDHASVASGYNNLGVIAGLEGDLERARGYYERALTIWEAALGPYHPTVGYSLSNLGDIALEDEDYAQAHRYHERALSLSLAAQGPEHPKLGIYLDSLGDLAVHEREYDRALELLGRSLALKQRTRGADHPEVAKTLVLLAQASIGAGALPDAIAQLERAITIRERHEIDPIKLADARFALARALTQEGDEEVPARARSLAGLARAAYSEGGAVGSTALAEVDAWLAESERPPL